jgi:hypothetical protein
MITGGDAKIRPLPQFGFSFRSKAEAFSVRLIIWLEAVPLRRMFLTTDDSVFTDNLCL